MHRLVPSGLGAGGGLGSASGTGARHLPDSPAQRPCRRPARAVRHGSHEHRRPRRRRDPGLRPGRPRRTARHVPSRSAPVPAVFNPERPTPGIPAMTAYFSDDTCVSANLIDAARDADVLAVKAHGERDGTRALIEVLLLGRYLPHEHLVTGLAAALRTGALTADAVALEARRRRTPTLPLQRLRNHRWEAGPASLRCRPPSGPACRPTNGLCRRSSQKRVVSVGGVAPRARCLPDGHTLVRPGGRRSPRGT